LLQGLGLGAAWVLLVKTDTSAKLARDSQIKLSSEKLIRPPNALPEQEFLARCARCGECMKVCPTGGLQPAIAEAGLEGFWSPVFVPKIGECTEKCNLCSQVCPTSAIQSFEIGEKPRIFLGTAVIDRSQCIVWKSGRGCLLCDEVCSYNAVYTKVVNGVRSPFVDETKCVGCGICENNCPIHPVSAIKVYSFGDKRRKRSSA
jgi:ferredoxin